MSWKMAKGRGGRRQRRGKKWGRKQKKEIEERKRKQSEIVKKKRSVLLPCQAEQWGGRTASSPRQWHSLFPSQLMSLIASPLPCHAGDRIAGFATYNDLLCSSLAQAKIFFPAPTRHGFICVSGCFWMAPISRRGLVVRGRAESGLSGTVTSPSRWRPCSWSVFFNQFAPQLWFWETPLGLLSLSPWECLAGFFVGSVITF